MRLLTIMLNKAATEQWFHSIETKHIGYGLAILVAIVLITLLWIRQYFLNKYPPGGGTTITYKHYEKSVAPTKRIIKIALNEKNITHWGYARATCKRNDTDNSWEYEIEYYPLTRS